MARESSIWKFMARARDLVPVPADLHMSRIENLAGVGHPDTEGCYQGVQWWLELKVAKRPARATTKLTFGSELKKHQADWALNRWAAGGKSGFLIQVGDGPERQLYLVPGDLAMTVMAGVTEEWLTFHTLIPGHPTPVEVVLAACRLNDTGDE